MFRLFKQHRKLWTNIVRLESMKRLTTDEVLSYSVAGLFVKFEDL